MKKTARNIIVFGNITNNQATRLARSSRAIIIVMSAMFILLRSLLSFNLPLVIYIPLALWFLSTYALTFTLGKPAIGRYYFAVIIVELLALLSISYLAPGISWVSPIIFALTIIHLNLILKERRAVYAVLLFSLAFTLLLIVQDLTSITSSAANNLLRVGSLNLTLVNIVVIIFFLGLSWSASREFMAKLSDGEIRLRELTKDRDGLKLRLSDSERQITKWREDLDKVVKRKTQEVAEHNHELEILNAIAISLGKSLYLDSILSDTMNQIIKIFPISHCEISVLYNPESNLTYIVRNSAVVKRIQGPKANRLSRKYVSQIVKSKKIAVVDLGYSKPQIKYLGNNIRRTNDLVIFPIKSKSQVVGTISVISAKNHYLNSGDIKMMTSITNIIGQAIENSKLYRRIKKLSDTDGVTGLFNHRYIIRRLESEFKRAVRYHHPFALMMIDVDKLKNVNDKYGHLFGDQALRRISLALISACRSTDIVGRYGGDEFIVIMPEAGSYHGVMLAERILKQVSQLELKSDNKFIKGYKLNVSIGLTSYSGEENKNLIDLLNEADTNLYAAKIAGGGRYIIDKMSANRSIANSQGFPLGA